jgi:hypothetical protein
MRPVEFGEAVPAGTRLTLFSADKPDRLFTVITFCIDKVSGVALTSTRAFPAIKSKTRKEESIYCFNCQSERKMKTAGAFGGPTRSILIPSLFLSERWLRNRKNNGVLNRGHELHDPMTYSFWKIIVYCPRWR